MPIFFIIFIFFHKLTKQLQSIHTKKTFLNVQIDAAAHTNTTCFTLLPPLNLDIKFYKSINNKRGTVM